MDDRERRDSCGWERKRLSWFGGIEQNWQGELMKGKEGTPLDGRDSRGGIFEGFTRNELLGCSGGGDI